MEVRDRDLHGILNSTALIFVGFIVSGAFSVLTRIVLGRLLEPSGYGLISEGLAVLNFLTVFSLLGISSGVSRYMAFEGNKFENVVASGLAFVLPLSFILTGIGFLSAEYVAGFIGGPDLVPVLQALMLNIPALASFSIIIGGFRGKEETVQKVVTSMILTPIMILAFTSGLTLIYMEPHISALGYTIAGWLSVAVAGVWYFRKYGLGRVSMEKIETLVRFSIPLGARDLIAFGMKWGNILLIGYFLSSSAAGIYNAAFPISYGLLIGLTSFNYIFMPSSSRIYSKNDYQKLKDIYSTVTRWLQAVTLPILIVVVFKASTIMEILFGADYIRAGGILAILALGQFARVFFGPLGQLLIAMGDTRQEAISKFFSLMVTLVTGISLIPLIGTVGAAIGFSIGALTGELFRLWFSRKHTDYSPLNTEFLKSLLAGLIAVPVLIPELGFLLTILQAVMFAVVYLSALIVLGALRREDLVVLEDFLDESPIPQPIKSRILLVIGLGLSTE